MGPRRSSWRERLALGPVLATVLGLAIAGYAAYQMKDLIRQPVLAVETPKSARSVVGTPLVTVSGQIARVARLWLDDGPIFADQSGHFAEKLLVRPGYNIIKVEAADRFGRRVARFFELTYQPPK